MSLELLVDEINTVELGIEDSRRNGELACYLSVGEKKKYVYSKYNPKQHAISLIDYSETHRESVWVILGLGLGYIAEDILEKIGPRGRILIVEPSKALFEKQKPYIEHILKDKRVRVFCGVSESELYSFLDRNIQPQDYGSMKCVMSPVYIDFFKQYYNEVWILLNRYINKGYVTLNTLNKFEGLQIENVLKNQEAIKNSMDIRGYAEKYKNIPAIVVSAGPSLNKNIEYLKEFKGIIFTGTRTVKQIMDLGIKPNFLVCLDSTDDIFELLQDYKSNDLNLIASEAVNPQILRHNTGRQYIIRGTQNDLSEALFDVKLPGLPLEGSVATLCTSVAQYMGCNPIVFIGQDLAYTDYKAHAQDFKSYKVDKEKVEYTRGYYGGEVPTDTPLLVFLKWFENFIRETKEQTQYINCTEGGAYIDGAEHRPFKEVVDEYQESYNICYEEKLLVNEKQRENMELVLIDTIEELKEAEKIASYGLKLSKQLEDEYVLYSGKRKDKVRSILSKLDNEVDKKLKTINKAIEQIVVNKSIELESRIELKEPYGENEKQRNHRITEKSKALYNNISEAISKVLGIIEKLQEEGR